MVLAGKPFRVAYKEVGLNLDKLATRDPKDTIANRTLVGGAGNLGLDKLRRWLADFTHSTQSLKTSVETALDELTHGE